MARYRVNRDSPESAGCRFRLGRAGDHFAESSHKFSVYLWCEGSEPYRSSGRGVWVAGSSSLLLCREGNCPERVARDQRLARQMLDESAGGGVTQPLTRRYGADMERAMCGMEECSAGGDSGIACRGSAWKATTKGHDGAP